MGLYLKLSEQVIEGGDGLHRGCTALMVDMCNFKYTFLGFKYHIQPEE